MPRRAAATMVVRRAVAAIPAPCKWGPTAFAADVTLVCSVRQESRNGKGGVTISVLADPLPWDPMHRYLLELVDGNGLNVCGLDMIPGDIKGRSQKRGNE